MFLYRHTVDVYKCGLGGKSSRRCFDVCFLNGMAITGVCAINFLGNKNGLWHANKCSDKFPKKANM